MVGLCACMPAHRVLITALPAGVYNFNLVLLHRRASLYRCAKLMLHLLLLLCVLQSQEALAISLYVAPEFKQSGVSSGNSRLGCGCFARESADVFLTSGGATTVLPIEGALMVDQSRKPDPYFMLAAGPLHLRAAAAEQQQQLRSRQSVG